LGLLKGGNKKGYEPWNKGLTKDTDTRIALHVGKRVGVKRPGTGQKIGHALKKSWLDEDFAKAMAKKMGASSMRPNKSEKIVQNCIDELELPYNYVGDGSFIIAGRIPDFINVNGQKKIIEFLGCHWHGCIEHCRDDEKLKELVGRVDAFKIFGYSTMYIWGHELKDLDAVKQRILEFDQEVTI
jgi:hypothetical protein